MVWQGPSSPIVMSSQVVCDCLPTALLRPPRPPCCSPFAMLLILVSPNASTALPEQSQCCERASPLVAPCPIRCHQSLLAPLSNAGRQQQRQMCLPKSPDMAFQMRGGQRAWSGSYQGSRPEWFKKSQGPIRHVSPSTLTKTPSATTPSTHIGSPSDSFCVYTP